MVNFYDVCVTGLTNESIIKKLMTIESIPTVKIEYIKGMYIYPFVDPNKVTLNIIVSVIGEFNSGILEAVISSFKKE